MQTVLDTLQQKCRAKYKIALSTVRAAFPTQQFSKAEIVFSNRLKTTAGYFSVKKDGTLNITLSNAILLMNPKTFLDETVVHEAAHQFVYEIFGDEGIHGIHGIEWQDMMKLLGVEPKAYHDMKTPNCSKRVKYSVEGVETTLGPIQHKKCQAGKANYAFKHEDKILVIKPEHWVKE